MGSWFLECAGATPSIPLDRHAKGQVLYLLPCRHMTSVLCIASKSALWRRVRNRVITHRKLPLIDCYHIFSRTRGIYVAKNHYENYSPQMVPMAQIWGPGSRTNRGGCPVVVSPRHSAPSRDDTIWFLATFANTTWLWTTSKQRSRSFILVPIDIRLPVGCQ